MKADKAKVNRLLKTARGLIDGILKLVEEDRYCIDISNQLVATKSIINKVNSEILKAHLENCVKDAFLEGDAEKKIDEIVNLLKKINN